MYKINIPFKFILKNHIQSTKETRIKKGKKNSLCEIFFVWEKSSW